MTSQLQYEDFIKTKERVVAPSGFSIQDHEINQQLFPFQKALVNWALKRGNAAIFADCGTGKSIIQLEWANHTHRLTGGDILIFAPLAVSHQTKREGEKFGIPVNVCRDHSDIQSGINITNYEMLKNFSPNQFQGLVLDESSALKNLYSGEFRRAVTDFGAHIPYKLACTATPAPNDTMELVNHAEFLGVMSAKEMLGLFFTQDFSETSHRWKLKGHASEPFWRWLSTWAVALRKPSDIGYSDDGFILPPLDIHQHTVATDTTRTGTLFAVETKTLDDQRRTRRETLASRVQLLKDLVESDSGQWLIWCDLNIESDAATKAIPGAVEITGSDPPEHKEKAILGFSNGDIRILVTKPSIAGFGVNWQSCHNMTFLGLSHSYEKYYQAIRRCWRFGQEQTVNVHIITADTDGAIMQNIQRKDAEAQEMFEQLVTHAGRKSIDEPSNEHPMNPSGRVEKGSLWTAYLGDSVETIDNVDTESVGLIVFSPPFPGMYVYTNTPKDMGNVADMEEMINHYRYLIHQDKLMRILKPGRSCLVHLTQGFSFKGVDGVSGLKDFRGAVIQAHVDAGWIYYGEVVIDKDPQIKAIRTKDRGLLFKTLSTDSSHMRMATPDYILQFKKPGDNREPIRAGNHNGNESGWITNKEWIEWAAPVWYRKSDAYPGGIRETEVLNVAVARDDKDDRHLCPLQLGVIERCVKLWSNPGDIVYSPFMGIGSEGYKSIELGRRFIGGELKESYFNVAVRNMASMENNDDQLPMFDCISK